MCYECALLEWFETVGDQPDPTTDIWVVCPKMCNCQFYLLVVSIDTIICSCHLVCAYGGTRIPAHFHFSNSLDASKQFYVNPYTDYIIRPDNLAIDHLKCPGARRKVPEVC